MDRRELTAFFINIYNALVIHGMVLFGPAETTLKRCALACPVPMQLLQSLQSCTLGIIHINSGFRDLSGSCQPWRFNVL